MVKGIGVSEWEYPHLMADGTGGRLMKWSDQSGTDILRQMECIQGLAVLSFEVKQSGQWTGKNVFLSYLSQVDVLKKLTFAVLQQNQNEH